MSAIWLFLLSLVILVNFAKMTEIIKEYDDPASDAYKELEDDFRKFEKAILEANLAFKPGRSRFFLKPKEKSCLKRCNETRDAENYCHCDRLCALYRDCCHDYWPRCNVKTKPFNQSTQELWECVDAKYKQEKSNRSLALPAYMMINRCPVSNITSNQSSQNCMRPHSNHTDISEVIPVIGEDGLTYRNAYCAKCHGNAQMTYWGLMVACLDPVKNGTNLTYGSAYLHENCTWYLSPANESAASVSSCTRSTLCESVVNTTESSQYKDLVNKCKAYSQTLEADNKLYKNFHCASCNGKDAEHFSRGAINIIKVASLSLFFEYNSFSGGDMSKGDMAAEESPDDVTQSYLTVFGLSSSMTCLWAVVLTYVKFSALRTVPGLVLIALSLSLLAYQGLLLASPYPMPGTPGCKAVAVLLHLMILLSFAWMTVMSYDVAKTFSQKGGSSNRSSSLASFRRYVIVAASISVLIVAMAFTLGETNAVHVGYGEVSCWIGKLLALILFFYVPVGIMLLYNAVSLIYTIVSIRNVTKLTKGVQKSGNNDTRGQNAKICSKLLTVMGVTWILGFGAPHNTIVAYLYIIINSLQGVFIFVAFVLNKRTMNMWRNTVSTRDRSSTNTGQSGVLTFNKSTTPYASTNQLTNTNVKKEEHELSFTNQQQS